MRPYGFVANSFVVVISSSALSAYAFVQTENLTNTVFVFVVFLLVLFRLILFLSPIRACCIRVCTSSSRSAQVFYSICSRGFSLCLSSLWLLLLSLSLLQLMLHKIHIIYMCCHVCIVCLYYHEYFCQFNS